MPTGLATGSGDRPGGRGERREAAARFTGTATEKEEPAPKDRSRAQRVGGTSGFEPLNRGLADLLRPPPDLDSCVKWAAGAAPEGRFRCKLPTKLPARVSPRRAYSSPASA